MKIETSQNDSSQKRKCPWTALLTLTGPELNKGTRRESRKAEEEAHKKIHNGSTKV